jgi:hypothetical protein
MHKSLEYGIRTAPFRLRHPHGAKVLLILAVTMLFPIAATSPLAAQSAPPKATSPELSPAQSFDLSDAVVRDVLTNFQRGLADHNLDRVLAVFDADAMQNYARFRDQMTAFFRLHDSVKFRYQLLQVDETKDTGFATADVEMDAEPADMLPTEHRRTAQMRFQLKRVGTVWKVTDLTPLDFFTQ